MMQSDDWGLKEFGERTSPELSGGSYELNGGS